jgi:hypothetical protein
MENKTLTKTEIEELFKKVKNIEDENSYSGKPVIEFSQSIVEICQQPSGHPKRKEGE